MKTMKHNTLEDKINLTEPRLSEGRLVEYLDGSDLSKSSETCQSVSSTS